MTPFFFGSSRSQLFGAYDPPPAGGCRGTVICYPLAREYLLAHQTLRYLARLLAGAGHHVLRFDYFGTGDSAGEFEEAGLERWIADIHTAIEELRDVGRVGQVTLLGLRFGGTLAAMAARGRRDVSGLVLWNPVIDGADYLAELDAPVGAATTRREGECEAKGVVLTPGVRHEIAGVCPSSFHGGPARTFLLATDETAGPDERLKAHLSSSGVNLTAEHVPEVPFWRTEWGREYRGMPVASVRTVVEWLS
jgi:pimeloyl-ACP methyl ester carboxylesterase